MQLLCGSVLQAGKSAFSRLRRANLVAVWLLLLLVALPTVAQQLTGSLSGTVWDQTGAVVPKAKITLINAASGDVRGAVSDGSGYWNITALPPATYSLTVTMAGFTPWQENGIVVNLGDERTVPNIKLKVASTTLAVEVVSANDVVVPVDNAEVSATLNNEIVSDLALGGRDAGELLKIMPGMALTNGLSQGSSFNTKSVGTNTGPVGSYSANGTQPNGAMAFMLDGANLVDPGNMGTQIANINQDMVDQVKVLMSSYGAEYARGPVIFEAFSKSGGKNFHGEGYFYAKNSALNAIESYSKSQILNNTNTFIQGGETPTKAKADALAEALPDEHYYYMGGNVGGPIILPFTGFNRDRKKLFFWGGYEYMDQHPAGSPVDINVPTAEQRGGVFDKSLYSSGQQNAWGYAFDMPSYGLPADAVVTKDSGGNVIKTVIPTSDFDPNITGLFTNKNFLGQTIIPSPNIGPSALNGWNNYQFINQSPQNRWEASGKIDYSISENTKLTGSYTRQIETDQHPLSIWWAAPWTLPYPSQVVGNEVAQDILTNFTHVFNATTTNEFVFTFAKFINPNTLSNPKAASRAGVGMGNLTGLFGHTSSQMPNVSAAWSSGVPNVSELSFDGGFLGNAFGGIKKDFALYDNFTKIVATHSLKAGFYWDQNENLQSSSNADNGTFNIGWGQYGTGSEVADYLIGDVANYQQASAAPVDDIMFHQWSVFAQDSWKADKSLTLNYGIRLDHVGQWYGVPKGIQVWDPASYIDTKNAPVNTGILYHAINSSVPLSGFTSPLVYFEPRVGFAYDIGGSGRTVLRGGFAIFRYQISTEACEQNACDGPRGAFTYSTPGFQKFANAASVANPPAGTSESGWLANNTIGVLANGDNRTPETRDWNVTLSQALPWRSIFEVSYVGNHSINEVINGGNGKYDDMNNIPLGGLWAADPITGSYVSTGAPCAASGASAPCVGVDGKNYVTYNEPDFRPFHNYGDIYLLTHGSYANYNALQASWQKQSGRLSFFTNYTFSKVMGIWDGDTSNGAGNGTMVDPFSLKNNYAPLAYDHTQILNLSTVWHIPNFMQNKLAGIAVNGWELSNWTQYQSGAPLQPGTGGNLNANYNLQLKPTSPDLPTLPNGLLTTSVSASSWLGTPSVNLLMPALLCNPRKGLTSGQYFNASCFGVPKFGTQGPLIWPYMRGPAYFASDLALMKNFKVTEAQRVQLRIQAQNFLNHPLKQFGLAGNSDEQIVFTSFTAPATTGNGGKPSNTTGQRIFTVAAKYYF